MPKKLQIDQSRRRRIGHRLLALPRPAKRLIMVMSDLFVMPLALWSALVFKYDNLLPTIAQLPLLLATAGVGAIPIFTRLGLYRAVVRYFGLNAMFAVLGGISLSTLLLGVADRVFGERQLTASVLVIYWALGTLYAGGTRMMMRYAFHRYAGRNAERVAIYGAGEAGAQLCAALMG